MARQRTIDPGFFRNEDLAELPFEARLLFAGLWTQADREGRLEDRPKRLKADVFPYDDVDVNAALDGLAERQMIQRYRVKGAALITVVNFPKFQRCHPREKPSVLPGPDEADPVEDKPRLALGKPLHGQALLSNAGPSGPSGPAGPSGPSGPSGSVEIIEPKGSHSAVGRADVVQRVFDAWKGATGRNGRTAFTGRRRALLSRWQPVYPPEILLAAAVGVRWSPHHMGDNDRGTKYDSLELIFRDEKHIELFSGYELDPATRPTGRPRGKIEREIRGQELDPDTAEYAFRVTA
ncbi:MAG: hypothetical protein WBF51_04070 [Candidatus Dormiibacterota bacterium]